LHHCITSHYTVLHPWTARRLHLCWACTQAPRTLSQSCRHAVTQSGTLVPCFHLAPPCTLVLCVHRTIALSMGCTQVLSAGCILVLSAGHNLTLSVGHMTHTLVTCKCPLLNITVLMTPPLLLLLPKPPVHKVLLSPVQLQSCCHHHLHL
jgi:hypothetical protein